jgi:hypothetical protein
MAQRANPFDLLIRDHERFRHLFGQFKRAEAPAEKWRIYEQVSTELLLHSEIEEKLLYPPLGQRAETHDKV